MENASDINKRVGRELRIFRERNGITRKEIASDLGKTVSAISKIESGKVAITADVLYAYSKRMGLPFQELADIKNKTGTHQLLKYYNMLNMEDKKTAVNVVFQMAQSGIERDQKKKQTPGKKDS